MNTETARRLDFSDVALYAVSPAVFEDRHLPAMEAALASGIDALQLRFRNLTDRRLSELAKTLKGKCEQNGALLLINNRVDVALASDADGVHLGHEDLDPAFVRELLGHRRIVGCSAHSVAQAIQAQRVGADYVSCGPLWATPTKPDYPAVGLGLIGLYKAAIRVPFVAIGGIDTTNIDAALAAGARCVAVVRALFDAADVAAATSALKAKVTAARRMKTGSTSSKSI